MDSYEMDEPISDVDYLKNLNMQDFLNCDETRKILQEENYQYFEENIKSALMRLFTRYAKNYNCDLFLYNDPDGEKNNDLFSEIVNNSLSEKNDLTVFYDNPHLAKKLLE